MLARGWCPADSPPDCAACRYSALDAKATYDLAVVLKQRLEGMECTPKGALGMDPDIAEAIGVSPETHYSMWDLYLDYWQPFGRLLTNMEAEGFNVDRWASRGKPWTPESPIYAGSISICRRGFVSNGPGSYCSGQGALIWVSFQGWRLRACGGLHAVAVPRTHALVAGSTCMLLRGRRWRIRRMPRSASGTG